VKHRPTKIKARFCSATLYHLSATEHFGALKLLAVTGVDSPFTATTFQSASPPESKLGSVLTPVAKLAADAQRPPGGAVLSQHVRTFALLYTVPASVTFSAIEQDEALELWIVI